MRKFITSLLLGASLMFASPVLATPPVPADAEQTNQQALDCEGSTILKYEYKLPADESLLIFKEPNQKPLIYIKFDANDMPVEAYVGERKVDFIELIKEFPSPCDAFKKA
jgi:hypothetical protein